METRAAVLEELEAQALLEKICASDTLPSVPVVAANILSLCQNPDVDFARLGAMASSDPVLVAKLLRMANSAFFGSSYRVFSVNAAVVRMGLKVTRMAVLGFGLETEISRKMPAQFKMDRFWRRSLTTATAARVIAENVRPAQRDESFSAGILQDIGIVALQCARPEAYLKILAERRLHPTVELHELERRALGVTHMEVGSRLLKQWKLPEEVYEPVRWHHDPHLAGADGLSPELLQVTRILMLSALVDELFHGKAKGVAQRRVLDTAQRDFRLGPEGVDGILKRTEKGVREACELFDVDPRTMPTYEQVRVRATQDVARLAAELGQEAQSAERRAQQHAEQLTQYKLEMDDLRDLAAHDDLTLLVNRREFLTRFVGEIMRSRRHKHHLSVLMLDIDHFKAVNDTNGHAAGDEVLRHLGGYLSAETRISDVAARIGGEEFAVLLPETDLDGAIATGEQLRLGIAAASKDWVQGLPGITVSVGAVHSQHDSRVFDGSAILAEADRCLYRAKHDGRNCTRYTSI